jgi:hypothetical protein
MMRSGMQSGNKNKRDGLYRKSKKTTRWSRYRLKFWKIPVPNVGIICIQLLERESGIILLMRMLSVCLRMPSKNRNIRLIEFIVYIRLNVVGFGHCTMRTGIKSGNGNKRNMRLGYKRMTNASPDLEGGMYHEKV